MSGTDTGIGKTVVAAWSCCCADVDYYKPLQCGLDENGEGDCEAVRRMAGLDAERAPPPKLTLPLPRAPYESRDGAQELKPEELSDLPRTPNPLLVEGVGGLLAPLNRHQGGIELAKAMGLAVVLVARSGLGTLNHTLLSLEALKTRAIPCYGIILHGEKDEANLEFLSAHAHRVIHLPWFERANAKAFRSCAGLARSFYGRPGDR